MGREAFFYPAERIGFQMQKILLLSAGFESW